MEMVVGYLEHPAGGRLVAIHSFLGSPPQFLERLSALGEIPIVQCLQHFSHGNPSGPSSLDKPRQKQLLARETRETDFSRREWDDYLESWECWGAREFVDHLVDEFDLGPTVGDFLRDFDRERLREFFEAGVRSGEYFVSESSGVSIRFRGFDCDRYTLATFILQQRVAIAVRRPRGGGRVAPASVPRPFA